jgi:hypothetical protein
VQTVTEIVKAFFDLKNIRRTTGDAGKLVGFQEKVNESAKDVYMQIDGSLTPWPTSMHVAVSTLRFIQWAQK